jgi:hypothetical protein
VRPRRLESSCQECSPLAGRGLEGRPEGGPNWGLRPRPRIQITQSYPLPTPRTRLVGRGLEVHSLRREDLLQPQHARR